MNNPPTETSIPIGDWTIGSLKAYHDMMVAYERQVADERDRRYQQRFDYQEKNVVTALTAIDKRLDILNELRTGVATVAQVEALEKIVDESKERVGKIENVKAGSELTIGKIYAAIATIGVMLTIIVLVANGVFR